MNKFTCPCCGYKTLDEEHEYDICPICFWEDDYLQFEDIESVGGANQVSLKQAQRNYKRFGASTEQCLKFVRKPNEQDIKDENWKPFVGKGSGILIAELQFDVSSDLIELPEEIGDRLEIYQNQFWKWLFDDNVEHLYWCFENGKKAYVSYRSDAFVEWLNQFVLYENSVKAKIIGTHLELDKNDCDVVLYF